MSAFDPLLLRRGGAPVVPPVGNPVAQRAPLSFHACRNLWSVVLAEGLQLACAPLPALPARTDPLRRDRQRERVIVERAAILEARDWLLDADFETVCACAGCDPEAVRERIVLRRDRAAGGDDV